MLTTGKSTLTQFLIEERRRAPAATGELNALITDVSLACKAISWRVAYGALDHGTGLPLPGSPVSAEHREPIDDLCNQIFARANEWGGHVAGMLSRKSEAPSLLPREFPPGKYLLLFNPLDGSANADANVTVGSIFSIARATRPGEDADVADFLQPGIRQVCAGYAIYGPSTLLVMTLGNGTHAFTLDPMLGEWVLSHPNMRIPPTTREFSIDASHSRFWEPAVRRYVDECLAGEPGPRGTDFDMRWIASLVAETHRILMRGGVFLSPNVTNGTGSPGSVRMLCEAHPIAFLAEQAGGLASNGRQRLMELQPRTLHESTGLVFGSSEEVARIERYHHEDPPYRKESPLLAPHRGVLASAA
ncbi:class 1 fructose-bisphosphatase [Variovorax sp. GT1P44]|uniref:class 1 fructose-bisphosphatase n=1 Tax=Variovorax sp. GT1P44 TaxID=3443742 RepID=UPI003F4722F2